jgi:hypothetical protein
MSIWACRDVQRDIQSIKLFLLYQGMYERCKLELRQSPIDRLAVSTRRSSPCVYASRQRYTITTDNSLNSLPSLAIHEVSVYNLQHEKFLERVTKTYIYPGTDG